jgi:hypothetical protein
MSMDSAIARARARTEQVQLRDTCTIRRQGSGVVYDDETGVTTPAWTALYDGPCRMKQPNAQASSSRVGEATVLLQQPEVHLPMSAPLMRPGDEITITGSANDPASVGRVFIIRDIPAHANATARRYGVTERTS